MRQHVSSTFRLALMLLVICAMGWAGIPAHGARAQDSDIGAGRFHMPRFVRPLAGPERALAAKALSPRMRPLACAETPADPEWPPLGTMQIWGCSDFRPFEYTQLALGIVATGVGGFLIYWAIRFLSAFFGDKEAGLAGITALAAGTMSGTVGILATILGVKLTVTSIYCLREGGAVSSGGSQLQSGFYTSQPALRLTVRL